MDNNLGFGRPNRGNLTHYGKSGNHIRFTGADAETDKAPQTYVRIMVELSYDTPRPDPDGELRRAAGADIRREVEKALTGDMLATKLGDATVTMRSMVMRQEENLESFGAPVSVTVRPDTEASVYSTADPRADVIPGPPAGQAPLPLVEFQPTEAPELIPAPTAQEARPGFGGVPLPRGPVQPGDLGYVKPHPLDREHEVRNREEIGRQHGATWLPDDDEDLPPNAGSAQ